MNGKYILFTMSDKTEYGTFKEAVDAYDSCKEDIKFLYQPDKNYILTALSSTGVKVGHDHQYHKNTAICYALFIADSKAQVERFLKEVCWRHQGAYEATNARIYRGSYCSFCRSNKDSETFVSLLKHEYLLDSNIKNAYKLKDGFGAIDTSKPNKYRRNNPYRMYN